MDNLTFATPTSDNLPEDKKPMIDPSRELPSGYTSEQLPDKDVHANSDPQPATARTTPFALSDDHPAPRTHPQYQRRQIPDAIFHIEVSKIKPNPHQPRRDFDEEALKELAASIQEFGILQPLVVSKIERDTETGRDVEYLLIAGERRLRAAQMLGWERVPVIIRSTVHKSDQLEMAIVENLQRTNLSPIETARAYAKLQDEFGLTQREVAARIGKGRETIANTLRLLNLPTDIQDAISKNQINESQGRLLLMIDDPKEQRRLFEELVNRTMSVRELRSRIHAKRSSKEHTDAPTSVDPVIKTLEEELQELLGARVKIDPPRPGGDARPGKEKIGEAGKIIISFYSPEEIEGIIQKLNPQPNQH